VSAREGGEIIHGSHHPVLLKEAMHFLKPVDGGIYVDGTLGAGGHAAEILRAGSPTGRLVGIDWDDEALRRSRRVLEGFGVRVVYVRDNFRRIAGIVEELGIKHVDGVLADLGVSSFQLEDPGRGFSFMRNGPLDMRMDRRRQVTAFWIVNRFPREKLEEILRNFGEEKRARRIALKIEEERAAAPIETTGRLARIVRSAIPDMFHTKRIDPATKTFMALRAAVNEEHDNLRSFLDGAVSILAPGGRVVVIAFHSLEDRIVKEFMAREEKGCICPPDLPRCACGRVPRIRILTRWPVRPSREETNRNLRARSARLRAAERI